MRSFMTDVSIDRSYFSRKQGGDGCYRPPLRPVTPWRTRWPPRRGR